MRLDKPTPATPDVAIHAQSVAEHVLGESIVGVYLFGSAVVGGLQRDSDVDVLVLVSNEPTRAQTTSLSAQLMEVSGAMGGSQARRPLELTVVTVADVVPWRFPPRAAFVYGEWLREQFEAGSIPNPVRDPDLAIVLKQALDCSVSLYGSNVADLLDPVPSADIGRAIGLSLPGLLAGAVGDERNVVLTLARMWLTASNGDIAPKDVAAEWVEKQIPPEHAAVLKHAREGYLGLVDDRWTEMQEEFGACVSWMKREIEGRLDAT